MNGSFSHTNPFSSFRCWKGKRCLAVDASRFSILIGMCLTSEYVRWFEKGTQKSSNTIVFALSGWSDQIRVGVWPYECTLHMSVWYVSEALYWMGMGFGWVWRKELPVCCGTGWVFFEPAHPPCYTKMGLSEPEGGMHLALWMGVSPIQTPFPAFAAENGKGVWLWMRLALVYWLACVWPLNM